MNLWKVLKFINCDADIGYFESVKLDYYFWMVSLYYFVAFVFYHNINATNPQQWYCKEKLSCYTFSDLLHINRVHFILTLR